MKKKDIVKKNREFENIILKGKVFKNKAFIIYISKNNYRYPRFGISVGKKIGNAVYRNKYKRRIRSIIDNIKNDCLNGYDYIIILKRSAKSIEYNELDKAMRALIDYIRKEINNEEKTK